MPGRKIHYYRVLKHILIGKHTTVGFRRFSYLKELQVNQFRRPLESMFLYKSILNVISEYDI